MHLIVWGNNILLISTFIYYSVNLVPGMNFLYTTSLTEIWLLFFLEVAQVKYFVTEAGLKHVCSKHHMQFSDVYQKLMFIKQIILFGFKCFLIYWIQWQSHVKSGSCRQAIFAQVEWHMHSVFSANCPFGKMSLRQNARSEKRPFGKTPVSKMSVRQNVRSAKCLSAKCPGTCMHSVIKCVVSRTASFSGKMPTN
jgi:hypothetical protein